MGSEMCIRDSVTVLEPGASWSASAQTSAALSTKAPIVQLVAYRDEAPRVLIRTITSLLYGTIVHDDGFRIRLHAQVQTGTHLPASTSFARARTPLVPASADMNEATGRAHLVPLGNGVVRPTTRYKPLLSRPRDVSAEAKNQKWREGKGRRRAERRAPHSDPI